MDLAAWVLQEVTLQVALALEETNQTARVWPDFNGVTTVRKNPAAPMPIVGSYRDNIDSGEMQASIDLQIQNRKGIVSFNGVLDAKQDAVLSSKPIVDVTDAEFDYDAVITRAIESYKK